MKRILLRTAALGTIVVLGLFAIAHAQRTLRDRTAAASEPSPANPVRSAQSDPEPGPNGVRANPLRPESSRAAPAENPPSRFSPGEAVPISATDPPSAPSGDGNPLRNPGAEQPLRSKAADPFGLRGRQADNKVRTTSGEEPLSEKASRGASEAAAGPAVEKAAVTSDSAAQGRPNVLRGEGQPAPTGLAVASVTGNTATAPAAADRGAGSTVADRYSNPPPAGGRDEAAPPSKSATTVLRSEPAPSQEPARFSADPATAPASIPRASAPSRNEPAPNGEDAVAADVPAGSDGAGQPGAKHLEGPQSPQVSIQKSAPPEIQVGKPAVFRVTVRNTGQVPAGSVEVRDQVPRGTRLIATRPKATQGPRGELVWNLGTLQPGAETVVEVQLMPTAEGEIGSVATVHFGADASARSIATRPKLVVETTGAPQVMIGDEATLTFIISNPGTGVATGVVLEEQIPQGLQHPAGNALEYVVGDLKPGESRKLELKLKAAKAGQMTNVLAARAEGNLRSEHRFDLQVLAPQLQVSMNGPKKRYLEREAAYQVSVSNPGSAPAQQVELVAYLPNGMKFVSANNSGHYDEATRAVYWRLEQLPPNVQGSVELVTLPIEAGQQSIKIRGTAQKTPVVEKEQPVVVEGIAAVLFQLSVARNPIEVGGETSYEIHVVNQGSKAATNVRVTALLPPELKLLAAEGPVRHVAEGNRVQFDGLASLAPKADVIYRVRVQGVQPGDLRMRCQLLTDEMQTPVTKEESTRVYADE